MQNFEQPALTLKNRVFPENFHCIEYSFTFRIFEQPALALKNRICPEIFHSIEISLTYQDF